MKLFNLRFRYQILLVMVPLAILPLIIMIAISSMQIANYLEKQNIFFYQSVLEQINNKIDFIYNQYGMTFDDIIATDNFSYLVNAPEFKSKIDETSFLKEDLGERAIETRGFTIRKIAFSRIEGEFAIVELDRKSLLNDKNYKIWQFSQLSANKDIDKMLVDPLYTYMKENNKKLVLGKMGKGVLTGFDADTKFVFIYPYYKDDAKTYDEFLLVIADKNFINKIYEEVTPIKYGTLYILDPINNIISTNHPSDNDYYEYDETKSTYILGEDNPNDPYENMSYSEYNMLNTNPDI
ncbi:MAG TPA: hypothetical protein PK771_16110, partial [Spirochaetota bacterium]|nr:hypothetical protein [Spirochaetota bacterium]